MKGKFSKRQSGRLVVILVSSLMSSFGLNVMGHDGGTSSNNGGTVHLHGVSFALPDELIAPGAVHLEISDPGFGWSFSAGGSSSASFSGGVVHQDLLLGESIHLGTLTYFDNDATGVGVLSTSLPLSILAREMELVDEQPAIDLRITQDAFGSELAFSIEDDEFDFVSEGLAYDLHIEGFRSVPSVQPAATLDWTYSTEGAVSGKSLFLYGTFFATPVPEPSTAVLVTVSAGALLLSGRRR